MQDAIFLLLGGGMGLLVFKVPTMLWLDKDGQLDKQSFAATYPKKRHIYYLYKFSPLVWLVIYPLIVFPGITTLLKDGSLILYFVGYFLLGGFGILDGLTELATGVAPIRRESGIRGSLGLSCLVVNDSVRRTGLLRLGITGGIAFFSWLIIFVLV